MLAAILILLALVVAVGIFLAAVYFALAEPTDTDDDGE